LSLSGPGTISRPPAIRSRVRDISRFLNELPGSH
jgi:hypothetical protein